jgi:hypothetical protein
MEETESPSAALCRLIAEEKAERAKFSVFAEYREGMQSEIKEGTSLRSILRNINKHRKINGKETVTFFALNHYVRTVGLCPIKSTRRKHRKKPAKPLG